jgi:cell division protein FtsN
VSPERDDPTEDQELYEDIPPRSIFAATWFRVVLVLIVLGVIGAVAVPYVLDWMNPPPVSRSASVKATSPVPPASPSSPLPASESAAPSKAEKPSSAEKKEAAPMLTPAPVAKAPATKSETKSTTSTDTSAKSSMAVTDSTSKASAKSESSSKTESTPKASAPAKTESAKTEAAPKSQVVAKAEPSAKDDAKSAAAAPPPAAKVAVAKATPPANPATPKAGGPFWVQVGAFKDPETAKRVATTLRDQNFQVEQSDTQANAKRASASASSSTAPSPAASPGDLYDVHVSGMSAVELTKRLSAKGLASETSGGTVVVKPSLPLRDAVTLSKDLAVDGLKVQVRRAGSGPATPASPPPATVSAGETLHRVRVGAFTEVAAARAAAKELEAKGYKPYIARGNE